MLEKVHITGGGGGGGARTLRTHTHSYRNNVCGHCGGRGVGSILPQHASDERENRPTGASLSHLIAAAALIR